MNKKIVLLLSVVLCMSCKNNWDPDDKRAFYQACTQEAVKWAGTDAKAKEYCDCVFEKMNKRYSSEEEVLEHIDILATDTGLIKCKEEIEKTITPPAGH